MFGKMYPLGLHADKVNPFYMVNYCDDNHLFMTYQLLL